MRTALALAAAVLASVGWAQHPGASLPLALRFSDESAQPHSLRDFFGTTPVVLVFTYFSCPELCPEVLRGTEESLRQSGLTPGKDYSVLAVSIDPRDTPAAASQELAHVLTDPAIRRHTHLLTTADGAAAALASLAGFRYAYDAQHGQFAHPAGFIVVNARGEISRYFFGVRYEPNDVRKALIEAQRGRIGALADQLLLICYRFDPAHGRYSGGIILALQIATAATVLVLGLFAWRLMRPRSAP